MPSNYVPLIVLQVSTSNRTYRGSLRPLKGQKWPKNHFFGHFWVCFVWFRKFSRIPIETREKCRLRKSCSSFRSPDRLRTAPKILLSWPISPLYSIHIYKKKFLTKIKCLKLISNHSMDVSGTYYSPFQGLFTHSGAWGGLRSHILTKNWPFLTPPANPVQFFWLKMPSKCVPWLVLQVSSSTPTSRGSLRPPKWRPKAKNGQKITIFGLDRPILVRWPCSSVA